ncbi:MAG: hypothetical protein ACYTEX_28255 [Planctomycetota bacterium]
MSRGFAGSQHVAEHPHLRLLTGRGRRLGHRQQVGLVHPPVVRNRRLHAGSRAIRATAALGEVLPVEDHLPGDLGGHDVGK